MIYHGGSNICGAAIGIIGLDTYYAKLPGHIKNATTFDFPVIYKNVKGAVVNRILHEPDRSLLPLFIEAACELEKEGVRAIAGSCGFLSVFQEELAEAVSIPVFTSSLMLIPMVSRMLRKNQVVGVMTACKKGLTKKHLKGAGCEGIPIAVAGMEELPEFREVILENKRAIMDGTKLEHEIVSVAIELVGTNTNIGALILECTDMPPYAHLIQQHVKLPVFDLTTLTNMICSAAIRSTFEGFIPE
jgi:aspartate/glutamate racemase